MFSKRGLVFALLAAVDGRVIPEVELSWCTSCGCLESFASSEEVSTFSGGRFMEHLISILPIPHRFGMQKKATLIAWEQDFLKSFDCSVCYVRFPDDSITKRNKRFLSQTYSWILWLFRLDSSKICQSFLLKKIPESLSRYMFRVSSLISCQQIQSFGLSMT